MATATKRAVKRTKDTIKARLATKVAKRIAKDVATSIDTIKRDRDVIANNAAYEARERGPESMVQWVTGVVRIFSRKNYAPSDKVAAYFVKEESRIRSMTKRDRAETLTKRDTSGVSASQFLGVLKLAKLAGGSAMWDRIAKAASNWSLSRDMVAKVRAYQRTESKWPNDAWLQRTLAKRIKDKRGSAGSGGGSGPIKLGGPALIKRMFNDAKAFKARNAKLAVALGCEVQLAGIVRAITRMNDAMKAHAIKLERAEKAAKAA